MALTPLLAVLGDGRWFGERKWSAWAAGYIHKTYWSSWSVQICKWYKIKMHPSPSSSSSSLHLKGRFHVYKSQLQSSHCSLPSYKVAYNFSLNSIILQVFLITLTCTWWTGGGPETTQYCLIYREQPALGTPLPLALCAPAGSEKHLQPG